MLYIGLLLCAVRHAAELPQHLWHIAETAFKAGQMTT
jgi:hypothetical protein